MAYSKLHSSLVNSSLWTEPDNVRILFITLLAMCDRNGEVYGSRPGLERAANIKITEERDPWAILMSPDPHSSDKWRNPESEGRRIEEIPGGFRLLNFDYYRGLRNDDDRREQNKAAQARHRDKLASASVSRSQPRSADSSKRKPISEAEPDAEAIYNAYPKKVAKPKSLMAIRGAMRFCDRKTLLAKTQQYAEAVKNEDKQFIPYPATWFNQQRFNDDPSTWTKHATNKRASTKGSRTAGTANERRAGQYDTVGKGH